MTPSPDFLDGILLMPPRSDPEANGYRWYASYDAILGNQVDAIFPEVHRNSRITAHGGLVLSAWHSTATIDVADLLRGVARRPIELQGYDDWIYGLATTAAGWLVISGPHPENSLSIFDVRTGRRLRDLHLARPATGLSCLAGRPTPCKSCPSRRNRLAVRPADLSARRIPIPELQHTSAPFCSEYEKLKLSWRITIARPCTNEAWS
mgnify:CR=1 FL=1